jgi:hypothetical protein
VQTRFEEFKEFMRIRHPNSKKVIANFIIHDVRRISLRHLNETQGIKATLKVSQHTTVAMLNEYLQAPVDRKNIAGV